MEIQLARTVALDQFRLNRLKAIEDNMLAWTELGPLGDKIDTEYSRVHHGMTQARAFFENDRKFNNLSLYELRITRNIHKNMKLLRELQAQRKAEDLIKAKAKPLTKAASATSEQNGSGFSPESSAPVTPAGSPNVGAAGTLVPVAEAASTEAHPEIPTLNLPKAA
jgi:hypothetical protein